MHCLWESRLGYKVMKRSKGRYRVIKTALLLIFVVCLLLIGREYFASRRQREQQKALNGFREHTAEQPERELQETIISEPFSSEPEKATNAAAEEPDDREPVILEKYQALYEQNHDLAGWLSIEGMVIDYPVMQCEDDEYYLHRDFYGMESKYGCLYVRGKADLADGTNVVIYGHNMKDGSMFGDLDLYQSADFCREHGTISFDTLYEERTYEVVAVFRSQVYDADEDVFKYYQFYEADTQEEFDDFYENIKKLSLYDTGVTAELGDTFVTLSTCAYHVTDGRFVVVAKRRKETV